MEFGCVCLLHWIKPRRGERGECEVARLRDVTLEVEGEDVNMQKERVIDEFEREGVEVVDEVEDREAGGGLWEMLVEVDGMVWDEIGMEGHMRESAEVNPWTVREEEI